MNPVLLTCISGLGVKGPACFLLEIDGMRLLLDFGRGPDNDALPDFDNIGPVDALILSHGHRDHVGALAYLDRIGAPPLFATQWLQRDLPAMAFGGVLPACGETKVLGLRVTTGRTGHAPGGVWLHFQLGDGFLYTGDYSPSSEFYAYDRPPPAATALIDASYGIDDMGLHLQRQALLDLVRRGQCLIPAPPDGRGVEIATFLHTAGIRVSLDSAHIDAVEKLIADPAYLQPGMLEVLRGLLNEASRLPPTSEPQGAMIVAGASGASDLAAMLIERWKDASDPAIVFTGPAAAGSPAEKLLASGRAASLRWNVHPTLSETRSLLASIGACRIIPAFSSQQRLEALAAVLDVVSTKDPIEIL